MNISILGSGMAGYGATYHLRNAGITPTVYDKNAYPFGHTVSYEHPGEGFIFDDGPHVSFTKDERIKNLFAEFLGGEFEEFATTVDNWWHGHWVKHPAICNLHGLPIDMVTNAITDFVDAQHTEKPDSFANYEEWLLACYGKTFYENFPKDYTIRYHTVEPRQMSTDWLGPRLYQADLGEVVRGALTPETEDVHYIKGFRYPKAGGFQSYLKPFLDWVDITLNHQLIRVDPKAKILHFGNGEQKPYEHLISSIALPDFIPMIDGTPQDVLDAAEKLACTSCALVNVAINREDISNSHWTYFYDMDYSFTRLSFPRNLSPHTVPDGCSAVQCEVYFSKKYKPVDCTPDECIEPVIRDLRRCGLIKDNDEIVFKNATWAEYANVIFDLERAQNLEIVHGYLADIGIHRAGRYGDWGYMWTDDSFKSGERAAQEILDSATR